MIIPIYRVGAIFKSMCRQYFVAGLCGYGDHSGRRWFTGRMSKFAMITQKKDEDGSGHSSENSGLNRARKAGTRIASGKYITFLWTRRLDRQRKCIGPLYELAGKNRSDIPGDRGLLWKWKVMADRKFWKIRRQQGFTQEKS